VTRDRLRAHAYWLADDARKGRYTGSAAQKEAAAYVQKQFQTLGLQPLGDLSPRGRPLRETALASLEHACSALDVAWQAEAAVRREPPRDLRIAWSPQLGCDFAIDADVLAALTQRVQALRAAGWAVTDADPEWGEAVRAYPINALQHAGLHALYGQQIQDRRQDIDPHLAAQIDAVTARIVASPSRSISTVSCDDIHQRSTTRPLNATSALSSAGRARAARRAPTSWRPAGRPSRR
jgi:hypothetical protein